MKLEKNVNQNEQENKQPELIIMVGLPGSGKSTYVRSKFRNHFVVRMDDIRKMMRPYPAWNFEQDEHIVFDTTEYLFTLLVNDRKDIVIDETCIKALHRKIYIDIAKQNDYYIKCIYLATSIDDCIKRRLKDDKGIKDGRWPNLILKFSEHLEEPKMDEGFDELIKIC